MMVSARSNGPKNRRGTLAIAPVDAATKADAAQRESATTNQRSTRSSFFSLLGSNLIVLRTPVRRDTLLPGSNE